MMTRRRSAAGVGRLARPLDARVARARAASVGVRISTAADRSQLRTLIAAAGANADRPELHIAMELARRDLTFDISAGCVRLLADAGQNWTSDDS